MMKLIAAYFQLFVPNAKRIFIGKHKSNQSEVNAQEGK
jgi:hypothetical protein